MLIPIIGSVARADEIDDIIPFVIIAESGGDSNAVSPAGAVGLMQITPIVLKEYRQECNAIRNVEVEDLKNPHLNKAIGEWYLRRLKDHYFRDNYTLERMLCAWNGGITKLRRYDYDCSKMPRESREFSKKVMRLHQASKKKTR